MINNQKILEETLKKLDGKKKLLLHACCGICSAYVLEYLTKYFDITVLYFNPNIYPEEEFTKRLEVLKKVINKMPHENNIDLIVIDYNNNEFDKYIKGFENEREGGKRCNKCFYLRLEKTAKLAKQNNFDYFTTTLSVSPHKNAIILNNIGKDLEHKYGVKYLYSDFKKKEGYKRSIIIAKEYNLYRQNYCGCKYSIY